MNANVNEFIKTVSQLGIFIVLLVGLCLRGGDSGPVGDRAVGVSVSPGDTANTGDDITATLLNNLGNPTVALEADDVTTAIIQNAAVTAAKMATNTFNAGYNFLSNGNMDLWQEATSFTAPNDDTYTADRWIILQDGNGAVDVAQDTSVPDGSKYSMKVDQNTANKRWMIVQVLESVDSLHLDNQSVSLSFWAKTESTEIAALYADVIAWDSTADSVTSDVVSAWNSAGANPTLVANWTYEDGTHTLKSLTSTWTEFTLENISINTASMANIAVVIGVDDSTITANDTAFITKVQMEIGPTATDYRHKLFAEEITAARRWWIEIGGLSTGNPTAEGLTDLGFALTACDTFNPPMRSDPTVTVAGTWATVNADETAPIDIATDENGYCIGVTATAEDFTRFRPNSTDDTVQFDARL